MDQDALPPELAAFLRDNRQLSYDPAACEVGTVVLNGLGDLRTETFNLQTYATPLEEGDPHADDEDPGFYHVPALSLVKECEHYDPSFLLSWLPQAGMFATGNIEHGHLLLFPGATWPDIVARPIAYLEAQFASGDSALRDPAAEYLRPWPKYPYGPRRE